MVVLEAPRDMAVVPTVTELLVREVFGNVPPPEVKE
jgi:hypothetical protein